MSRIVAILLVLLLAGCGFQLRGLQESGALPERVFVDAPGFSPVAEPLKRTLRGAETQLVDSKETAVVAVRVSGDDWESRTLALNNRSTLREILLTYRVSVEISQSGVAAKPVRENLQTSREYSFDSSGVLGSSDQEEALLNEMRRELVQSILFSIARTGGG